jgi:hypothetical protein
MQGKFRNLSQDLAKLQKEAASAHIAGDRAKAECLTGKAVGIKHTMEIAERAFLDDNQAAVGELEGMEHVIKALQPLKRC